MSGFSSVWEDFAEKDSRGTVILAVSEGRRYTVLDIENRFGLLDLGKSV
jgi:hypothetical protein